MFLYFELRGKDKAPWSGFSYALDSCDVPAVFDELFLALENLGERVVDLSPGCICIHSMSPG